MPEEKSFDKYLERRAEQLGLPTDPEAYQDGGLAVAATARNLAEAEAVAMYLKSCDVPAWVDSPLSALYSEGYIRPSIAVRVPLGRLADAQKFLFQHTNASAAGHVFEFLIMVLVAASCCVIGIIALRRPREGT
ncbi:MAG: hypothetical protein NT049_05910 [Planctomycetota bacterium]|nr:hypothetical protein [Planctomycetota bacterium]